YCHISICMSSQYPLTAHPLYPKILRPPRSTLVPYTTLFRSSLAHECAPAAFCGFCTALLFSGMSPAARLHSVPSRSRASPYRIRSEEHTSELQSRFDLVCSLLLEKKTINIQ